MKIYRVQSSDYMGFTEDYGFTTTLEAAVSIYRDVTKHSFTRSCDCGFHIKYSDSKHIKKQEYEAKCSVSYGR